MQTKDHAEPFILKFDDFGSTVVSEVNRRFSGTQAEIPVICLNPDQEVEDINMLKRLAITTVLFEDHHLRNYGILPITPLQSESYLKAGTLPKSNESWEDLALIIYDSSDKGTHSRLAQDLSAEIKRFAHCDDARANRSYIMRSPKYKGTSPAEAGKLIDEELESKLIIVHAGLEKDSSKEYGVRPVVLPGLTQIYAHDTLNTQGNNKFEYGLDKGLPFSDELGHGERTLHLPSQKEDIGLRVLVRTGEFSLKANHPHVYEVESHNLGRITLTAQAL